MHQTLMFVVHVFALQWGPRYFDDAHNPVIRGSTSRCHYAHVPTPFDPFPASLQSQLRLKVTNLTHSMYNTLAAGAHRNTGMLSWQLGRGVARKRKPCNAQVPRLLHYIWLGSPLRKTHARQIDKMLELNPGWAAYIWVDRPVPGNLHPAAKVTHWRTHRSSFKHPDLIDREQNLAGKANYMRLEVVYMYGGVYLDTDAIGIRPFDAYGDLFNWPFVSPVLYGFKNVCNCVFSGVKHSPFLEFAIDAARENCLKYNTCGNMNGAGPGFLTGALLAYQPENYVMIDQKYMLIGKGRVDTVMYQTFEANWM